MQGKNRKILHQDQVTGQRNRFRCPVFFFQFFTLNLKNSEKTKSQGEVECDSEISGIDCTKIQSQDSRGALGPSILPCQALTDEQKKKLKRKKQNQTRRSPSAKRSKPKKDGGNNEEEREIRKSKSLINATKKEAEEEEQRPSGTGQLMVSKMIMMDDKKEQEKLDEPQIAVPPAVVPSAEEQEKNTCLPCESVAPSSAAGPAPDNFQAAAWKATFTESVMGQTTKPTLGEDPPWMSQVSYFLDPNLRAPLPAAGVAARSVGGFRSGNKKRPNAHILAE